MVSAYCLPPTCQPIFSSLCSICLPPTCLPIPLYLPTDWLSTADLSTHLIISMQYLSTADLPYVYLSFYSFVSANCLPPTCQPMPTDYPRPVYRLSFFQFLCICQPPTCSPMFTDYLTTADLSTVHLSSYSFAFANCLPVYWRPANLCPLTT